MKLFRQIIIPCIALLFLCNGMSLRLSHVNPARMILCMLITFNCAIFANTSLVGTILPQRLDRFRALVYG